MTTKKIPADTLVLWPEELQHLVHQIIEAQLAGTISPAQVTELAPLLVAGDAMGELWTVGFQTGNYYRWDGTRWEEDQPVGRLFLLSPEGLPETVAPVKPEPAGKPAPSSPPDTCAQCGVALRSGARFCTQCGSARGNPSA